MSVIRPESTSIREDQTSRLLMRGYYPIPPIPNGVLRNVRLELGPRLVSSALPKIPSGTVAEYDVKAIHVCNTGTCYWGPVFYTVLYRVARTKNSDLTRIPSVAEFIRFKDSPTLQEALLVTYTVRGLSENEDSATLEASIQAALRRLKEEKHE